jgi:predicted phage-related endonuclease
VAGIKDPLGGTMTIQIDNKSVILDENTAQWLKQYRDAQVKVKEWQEIADIARSHLEVALGENEVAIYQGQEVVRWTTVTSKRFDVKKAREMLPANVISLFESEQISRRFTLTDQDSQ